MKGKKDIIALDYKIIEINLLKSRHGTHRKLLWLLLDYYSYCTIIESAKLQ